MFPPEHWQASESEWYKAAYHNPAGSNYFLDPTGSDTAPTAVASGTAADTAVYGSVTNAPAGVEVAGGLSAYGTMGQGGNVWEWSETAFDITNSSPCEARVLRGGDWSGSENTLDPSPRRSRTSSVFVLPVSLNLPPMR